MTQERKKIEFINDSLTTMEQHLVIQKIASHFGISNKMMRTALDVEAVKDNIIRFPDLSNVVQEDFYVVREKFKLANIVVQKQFLKSKLYARMATTIIDGTIVILVGSIPWVMVDYGRLSNIEGVGGMYIHYKEVGEYILLPLSQYLQLTHPSPQE